MKSQHYEFWKNQQSPLHSEANEFYYQKYADELRLLWRGRKMRSVLDLGCGNGDLYGPLGFDTAQDYVGVDFSPAMLAAFRRRYPELELHELAAEEASWSRRFDLIVCNGVVQYMNRASVAQLLGNCRAMSDNHTLTILGSIPLRRFRSEFITGRLAGRRPSLRERASWMIRRWQSDGIGKWWEIEEIRELSEDAGFACTVFGSIHYPYRFHVALSLR
jgi:cyclopropane fatty-acyl-phospholipid synthase-like methyltransferase